MRIDSGLPIQSKLDVERAQKKPASGVSDTKSTGVTSELSQDVVRLSSLEAQAKATPDIRQDKVKSLQQAISSGTYEVSNEALADSILKDVLKR
jgi:flagellar biosynthesis anti-sigma factor FlgM